MWKNSAETFKPLSSRRMWFFLLWEEAAFWSSLPPLLTLTGEVKTIAPPLALARTGLESYLTGTLNYFIHNTGHVCMLCSTKSAQIPAKIWHERSAFGRSAAGNDIVATISISLFFFPPVFFPFFPPSRHFFIEGVLGSKNLFSESCLKRPKT